MASHRSQSRRDKADEFNRLLQNFSRHVDETHAGKGTNVSFSEELVLEPAFPKQVLEPFERYLGINPTVRLHTFFESLHPYDILVGKVTSAVSGQQMHISILSRLNGQQRYIMDLNITGIIDTPNAKCSRDEELIKVGDLVKGVVTYINRGAKTVHLSFQEKHLRKDQIHFFPLGKLSDEEEGEWNRLCANSEDDDTRFLEARAYKGDLERSTDFTDPHSIKRLLNELEVSEEYQSFLGNTAAKGEFESAEAIRERQSSKWSMDMVGAGVKHFRENRLKEAMKCFDQSISFYPKNVEAYVARGALKANRSDLKEAVEDFREALRINSKHRNACKYLVETLSNIAKRHEKDKKLKEALDTYKEMLELDSNHTEAQKQYNHIKKILAAPKVAKQSPTKPLSISPGKKKTLSVKSKERLKKLKTLLLQEVDGSDSSSSSSSSTDSNSSGDEMWVEKPEVKEKTLTSHVTDT